MGLMRSRSQTGGQQKASKSAMKEGLAMVERNTDSSTASDAQRQKSVSSQERPRTAHSQPDRVKTADRHGQDRPKTADRQQAVDRRRSFSRPRTATSANSTGRPKDTEQEKGHAEMALPTQTIEYRTGKDTYNFPTPSPRLPPPKSTTAQAPSPGRSPLPVDDSPRIGVAIGSPRENAPRWGRTHTVDQVAVQPTQRAPLARAKTELPQLPEQQAEQLPKKKGSWKSLGGIFGRKPSTRGAVPEPFYQMRPPQSGDEPPPAAPTRTLHSAARQHPQAAWTQLPAAEDTTPLPPSAAPNMSKSMTRGMARMEARMQADRATFEEGEDRQKQNPRRVVRTPSIIQKEGSSPAFGSPAAARSSEEIFKTKDAAGKRNDSPLSNVDGSGPLRLDLDIPDHHMERYSVMFQNFLSSSGERRPSIIERRQSKLQKKRSLKRLDETKRKDHIEMPKVPQRSATSPHLTQTPGLLSIKTGKKVRSPKASPAAPAPDTEAPVTAVHRPPIVKRSNTAPIQTSSPVRRNFSKPRMVMIAEPTAVDRAPQLPAPRGLSIYSENSLPPTPTSGVESGEESPVRAPPLPTAKRPQHKADHSGTWDMLTANPNTTAIPKRQASLARQEPDPYGRVKSPEDLEGRVVQVSVARQVSVSKARKQVRQAVDSKQPLRPRVVELGKNRKSTMVLIEGGEE